MKKYYSIFLLLFVPSGCKKNNEQKASQTETKTYPIGIVNTRLGTMYFWLYDETPIHKAKFIELAKAGHYDQFTFNRVVKNFVIQGGCPDSVKYFENSPFLIPGEFSDSIKHIYGALGMGRDNNPQKQSNACQFYIVNKEAGLPNLDGDYSIFGIILKGKEVLEAIEKEQTNATDEPLLQIPLKVSIGLYTAKELKKVFGLTIK
jgi:peptidyl-prolyl cis-trans isomerase B (cyclophilin B)